MSVKGFVLVETEMGKLSSVILDVCRLEHPDGKIVSVSSVTGPIDAIVEVDGEDTKGLGRFVTEALQQVSGVQRTTTCLAFDLNGIG